MSHYLYRENYQSAYGSMFDAFKKAGDPDQKDYFIKIDSPVSTSFREAAAIYDNDSEKSAILAWATNREKITVTYYSNNGWAYGKSEKYEGYVQTGSLDYKYFGYGVVQEAVQDPYENYQNNFKAIFDGDELSFTISRDKGGPDKMGGFCLSVQTKSGDKGILDCATFSGFSTPPQVLRITDGAIVFSTGEEMNTYMLSDRVEITERQGQKYKQHIITSTYLKYGFAISAANPITLNIPIDKNHQGAPYIPDIPGQAHDAVGNIKTGLYIRFDSNGDELKDMLMTLKLKTTTPKQKQHEKTNDNQRPYESILLSLKSYTTGETFEAEVRPSIFNDYLVSDAFKLSHIQRTDGVIPNFWDLMGLFNDKKPEAEDSNKFKMSISAPVRAKDKLEYNIRFANYQTKALFSAEKTEYAQTIQAINSVEGLDKLAVDLKLGIFEDKLRLVLEPTPGSGGSSNLYLFMYINGNELAVPQTIPSDNQKSQPVSSLSLQVAPPYKFSVLQIADKTENIAIHIDLNGDGEEDLVIYDRLIAYSNSINGYLANNARQHRLHLKSKLLEREDTILRFDMQFGKMIRNPEESQKEESQKEKDSNEETFLTYMKFLLPGDFDKNKKPGNIDTFDSDSATIQQITHLRKTWKDKLKTDVPFTDKLDSTWNRFVTACYALMPLKNRPAPGSDTAAETQYKTAINNFYTAFSEEIARAEQEHGALWKFFKGFDLDEPDATLLRNLHKLNWETLNQQLNYYAQRYADWAATVMQNVGEKARQRDEKSGGVFIANYETQQAAYAKGFSQRMKAFNKIKNKPGLQQLRAVHYPKNYTHQEPGGQPIKVTHVPLDIYYWEEDGEWHVFDLTNPDDTYEQDLDVEDGQWLPPKELFEMLNKSGHFTEGYMVVELPDGSTYQVATRMEHDAAYYATYIAFALLAAGLMLSVVGAPGGVAVLAGEIALASAEVAFAVSGVLNLQNLAAHDKLTFTNVALEVGNIILGASSALIRVPGKILSTAAKSETLIFGNMVPLIKASKISYIALHGAQKAGGGIMVLAMQMEAIEQLAALEGKGTKEDMLRAGQAILFQLLAAGMIKSIRLSGQEALTAAQEGRDLKLIEVGGKPCFVSLEKNIFNTYKSIISVAPESLAKLGTRESNVILKLSNENGEIIGEIKRVSTSQGYKYYFTHYEGVPGAIVQNKQYDLKSIAKIIDPKKNPDFALSDGDRVLYMDFQLPAEINEQFSGIGKIMFEDAFVSFNSRRELTGIYGMWIKKEAIYASYGGLSINLKKFNELTRKGVPEEEAAFMTITGGWAKGKGFNKVNLINLEENEVKLIFRK